jgi:hypothetical protein
MRPWLATVAALAVAAGFFMFAEQWRVPITLAIIIAAVWWFFSWLLPRHPYWAIFLISLLRGLFLRR